MCFADVVGLVLDWMWMVLFALQMFRSRVNTIAVADVVAVVVLPKTWLISTLTLSVRA